MGVVTLSNDCAASRACERRFLRSSSEYFVSFGRATFKQPSKARISDLVKSIAEISVKMNLKSKFVSNTGRNQTKWIASGYQSYIHQWHRELV